MSLTCICPYDGQFSTSKTTLSHQYATEVALPSFNKSDKTHSNRSKQNWNEGNAFRRFHHWNVSCIISTETRCEWIGWVWHSPLVSCHYNDVIMSTIASQITSLAIVYSIVYSSADQSKHQSSASLAFVWGIHRGPVNSPHKGPVTRKMFPFDDVIMLPTMSKAMTEITTHRHREWYMAKRVVVKPKAGVSLW